MAKRRLTKGETRLLILCFLVLFLVVNAILFSRYRERKKVAEKKISDLKEQISGNEARLSDREYWETRAAWLDEKMPTGTTDEVRAEMLELIQAEANELGIEIGEQSLVKPAGNGNYREAAVTVSVEGPERSIYQWLAGMQNTDQFQAIKFLHLDRDAPEEFFRLDCRVTLARWLKP